MNQAEFARSMKRLSSFYFKDFSSDDLMAWYELFKDGYFKQGIVELDSDHEMRNYEKAVRWIEEGIIPGFLKEDMKKYMLDTNKKIDNNNSFLRED